MALNVAYVDSVQIIHIETTLTKQVTWLFSGLGRFMNLEVYDVNMDYVDYLWLLWIVIHYCYIYKSNCINPSHAETAIKGAEACSGMHL